MRVSARSQNELTQTEPRPNETPYGDPATRMRATKEVLVPVDRALDVLELGELLLGSLLAAGDLGAEQRAVAEDAEEELEQESVARHAADQLATLQSRPRTAYSVSERRDLVSTALVPWRLSQSSPCFPCLPCPFALP